MTALLTNNLPLLAGASNGIKNLRTLILELAVRGKLVPQDPSDEPASVLLTGIVKEKARLVAEGSVKKQKPLPETREEELYELPMSWQWSSLSQVAFVNPRNAAADHLEVSFVPMTFIGTRFDDQHAQESRLWSEVKQGFTHFAEGDIGVAKITPCFENSKACVFSNLVNSLGAGTTELHVVRPIPGTLDPRYVLAYLKSPQFLLVGETKMTGTAGQKRLPKDFVETNPFPLPPLAEQHRIVAKVDELMALCDRLETQQANSQIVHTRLVQTMLDSLAQASDAIDFATNWQLLAEHFHSLFTTEPSIDALKQTLLQLAVMGKLVSQDPIDKTGTELLERIQNSRVDKRKIVKLDEEATIVERLPESWIWSSIDQLSADDSRAITDGPFGAHLKTEHYIDTPGYRVIRLQNIGNGVFRDEHRAYINQERFEKIIKHQVSSGDLVIAGLIDTSIRCCYVPANIGPAVVKADCYRFSVHPLVSSKYVLYYLNSKMAHEFAAVHHHGLTLTRIGLGNFRSIPVPLPPAAEQHRIAAKVDQLMALCDQLKIRLNQARQINEQLASTLVECALAEDSRQAPIATDRQVARTLLAAEITHQLHSQRTFGQRKLQKVIYLAEHTARLAAIQGNYLRDAAGPHDRQLMNKVEGEMQNHQWYERIERETVGHAYRPLSQAGQHRQAYSSAWSAAERATIEQVIELMRDWDTDRCEMTVTLYAAWNDFILEGRPISDEAIVDEVMHSWNDTKLRFGKAEWLAILTEMKKHTILMPTGFGKRTKGGMLSLPGFE